MKFLFWFTQILAMVAELVVVIAISGRDTSFAEFHGSAILVLLAMETFVFVLYYFYPSESDTRKFLTTNILCSISLGFLVAFLATFWLGDLANSGQVILSWFIGVSVLALPIVSGAIKTIVWYGDLWR